MTGRTGRNGSARSQGSDPRLKELEREMKETDRRTDQALRDLERAQKELRKLIKR